MKILRMILRTQKIADFRKLGPIEEQATTPDLDQLDRLIVIKLLYKDRFQLLSESC